MRRKYYLCLQKLRRSELILSCFLMFYVCFDFAGGFNPVEAFCLLAPETFWVVHGLLIHCRIFIFIGPCLGSDAIAHWIDVFMLAHEIASVREVALSRKWCRPYY